jgi:DNA-binding NarL/FixJ family response regulator
MHESNMLKNDVKDAGAVGYVVKSRAARDLVTAIDRVLGGGTFFSESGSQGAAGTVV